MEKSTYKLRRESLLNRVKQSNPSMDQGVILLFADFEVCRYTFRQESSFYYFTGLNDPGLVFCIYADGREVLFVPNYKESREKWVNTKINVDSTVEVKPMGDAASAYWLKPFFNKDEYTNLIGDIKSYMDANTFVLSLLDRSNDFYFSSIYRFEQICSQLEIKNNFILDISKEVSGMRRIKDPSEIKHMSVAADITTLAHKRVAKCIKPGLYEYDVLAEVESVFTKKKARSAFPSIIASGKNSTVLHYADRDQELKDGDLLVVDIGAEKDFYCSDITRTYPVGGKFSARQREIYDIVLETQHYIADVAKPGLFLRSTLQPEKSLHHLAHEFLKKYELNDYFVHGIGHFLGMDVHDVGDFASPLREGDVITIEPGIYLPDENIGIRIEDDFVITADGSLCLSPNLPKKAADIEALM